MRMKMLRRTAVLAMLGALVVPVSADDKHADESRKPLVLASQGSFFVGGEPKALPAGGRGGGGGDVTINQMYVQYQVPVNGARHVPVVMVHGCCLSSKTWETTPDGRMGWNEYFVRKDRAVYLADQVSR